MNVFVSIFAVGILIALHELGHFWVARLAGMKVLRYSVGFLHPIASWTSKKTGIAYQIGIVPLGGFVQIKGLNPFEDGAYEDSDSYQMQPIWKRAAVVVAGPLANFLIAWALMFALLMAGIPEPIDEPVIGAIEPGTPAAASALAEGDRLVYVGGAKLESWGDLVQAISAHPGERVNLIVKRGERQLALSIVPADRDGVGKIGVRQAEEYRSLPPLQAAWGALRSCGRHVARTVGFLALIIGGEADAGEGVMGPLGIVKTAARTLDTGALAFLALMAYLSLMLALFNLFPLPALDGGRGVFLLFEAITRRRVNKKVDAIVNTVGFLLLMGVIVLITFGELKDMIFG
jgi:regulator of sigma E protease